MPELYDAIDSVLDRWADGDASAEELLGSLVDVLRDNVEPIQTATRGRQPNHWLLPLLVWAEVSRTQILDRKLGVSTVIHALADRPLPDGKSYGEKHLQRLYQDGLGTVGKLDPWVLSDVQGAIHASDRNETHLRQLKNRAQTKAGSRRKEYEAWLESLSDKERSAEAERIFLNQLREQIALPVREPRIIDTCLVGIAQCRGVDLSLLGKDDAQKWVNSLLSTI